VYKQRLLSKGVKAAELPVFSNIPNVANALSAGKEFTNEITIAFFSQFLYRQEIITFLEKLIADIKSNGLKVKVVFIGGSENSIKELYNKVKALNDIDELTHTGFLDEITLSSALIKCHLGITPVPLHLVGKSGSVSAFLTHGVPIAAPYSKPGFENIGVGFFSQSAIDAVVTTPTLADIKRATGILENEQESHSLTLTSEKIINDLNYHYEY
jgi:hypothetical protein